MALTARFRCIAGCTETFPVTQAVYRCPTCQGLLEVEHPASALEGKSPEDWKALLRERAQDPAFPNPSGVWAFREWVFPGLQDKDIVTTFEGRSPLLPVPRLAARWGIGSLAIKQCGHTHTGSFKDLGMTVLVSVAQAAMAEAPAFPRALACASTGDTSAALAAYGALAQIPVFVLLPRGLVSAAQLVQPMAHGARVLALDTDFDGCMRIVGELANRGLFYLANSMNPLRLLGQQTVAFEIAQSLGFRAPDWVVLPSGNLGNSAALHAGFSLLLRLGLIERLPRLCIAQAERANPMVQAYRAQAAQVTPMAAGNTLATAIQIGAPVSAPRALRAMAAMNGVAMDATENELADAAAEADRFGLFSCPHTAVALAATKKLRQAGTIAASDEVVVVSTAHGLKFTEFKSGYHEGTLPGIHSERANAPTMLPADADIVAEAVRSAS
jgi:threonine synthase